MYVIVLTIIGEGGNRPHLQADVPTIIGEGTSTGTVYIVSEDCVCDRCQLLRHVGSRTPSSEDESDIENMSCVPQFSITPTCRQPHSVFGG